MTAFLVTALLSVAAFCGWLGCPTWHSIRPSKAPAKSGTGWSAWGW
jgi:hypothetical protein